MTEIPQSYNGKPLTASWTYCAMDGAPFGVVGRYQNGSDKKDIVPFFKRNGSGWTAGIELNPRPLFGLDKLAAQPKDKAVFIVEGEKAAAALHNLGLCAVTSLGGSQAGNKADWTALNGFKTVYLLPDNDEPGNHYAQDVYGALSALESHTMVKLARLSDLPEGGDVVDWLENFAPDWDGLQPFPDTEKEWALAEFRAELKKAEPVPPEWNLAGLAGSTLGVFDWEKPNEIETKIPPVQALQPGLIPEPFRPWLADVSYRMQTPPDFSTVSAIVITGSVIGAGCGIRPKRLDDWEVIPNLWGACIGRPSVVLKTPSMKEP
ncbi:MAG: toprim domain-containing protein, partial [Methylobacter sp.]